MKINTEVKEDGFWDNFYKIGMITMSIAIILMSFCGIIYISYQLLFK